MVRYFGSSVVSLFGIVLVFSLFRCFVFVSWWFNRRTLIKLLFKCLLILVVSLFDGSVVSWFGLQVW